MNTRIAVLVAGMLVACAVSASAQTDNVRLFVNLSVGIQGGTQTSTTTLSPTVYGETASIVVSRTLDKKRLLDLTVGRPLSGKFGAAVSFSARSSTTDGQATASIPDPIFFGRPRTVTSSIADMVHTERWFAVMATWSMAAAEKIDVTLMVGPAVVSVKHDAPTAATVTEAAGGPQVRVTIEPQSKSLAGIQLGADVRYALTPKLGAGVLIGFNRASGSVVAGDRLELGGFRLAGGLRVTF